MRNEKDFQDNRPRYRLYREHKYIFALFSTLVEFLGKADFCDEEALHKVKRGMKNLEELFQRHSEYEETRIHTLLRAKGSKVAHQTEDEHQYQHDFFKKILTKLENIGILNDVFEKNTLGFVLYLEVRSFFSDCLTHFYYEETVIMHELQRLFTDDELREVDRQSYRAMLPEQMVYMTKVLFPYINREDRFVFLDDMHSCEPEKFAIAWQSIAAQIDPGERQDFIKILQLEELAQQSKNTVPNINLHYPWEDPLVEESFNTFEYHKKFENDDMARKKIVEDDAVLKMILEVISEVGATDFSLEDLRAKTGLSPATLLQRFGSKQEMLHKALALANKNLKENLFENTENIKSAVQKIIFIYLEFVKSITTPEQVAKGLPILQLDITDKTLNEITRTYFEIRREKIKSLLLLAIEQKEIAKDIQINDIVWNLEALWQGNIMLWALIGEGELHPWLEKKFTRFFKLIG